MNAKRVVCIILAVCAFGLGMAPRAQSQGPVKIVIIPTITNAASLSKDQKDDASAVGNLLSQQIAIGLSKKYPCAESITEFELAALLGHEKELELLSANDPNALGQIAAAAGGDYLLSITITVMGPGIYVLNGSMINEHTAKTEARSDSGQTSGDIQDAIDKFADQFTSSLTSLSKFSKDKCTPTNAWIGRITYKVGSSNTTHYTPSPLMHATRVYDKGEGTSEITSNTEVQIDIPWAGPIMALVNAQYKLHDESVWPFRAYCDRAGKQTATGSRKHVESNEAFAVGEGESSVNAFFDSGKFVLHVDFPQISGTLTRKVTGGTTGGCPGDQADDQTVSSHGPWNSPKIYSLDVRVPGDATSKTQSGTFKDAFGGTLTWNLTRTPLKK